MANSILQSGQVTPGHLCAWTTDGVAQDAGSPSSVLNYQNNTVVVDGNLIPATAGSPYTVGFNTNRVLVNKTIGAATAIVLPLGALKQGPVLVKDTKGDAGTNNITVTFLGGESGDGQTSWVIQNGYGGIWFNPLATGSYYLTQA